MKTVNFNKKSSIFSQNLGKTDSGGCHGNGCSNQCFTIIFLVLSGNDHSVKVSSNSEVGSGTALLDCIGFLRELVLKCKHIALLAYKSGPEYSIVFENNYVAHNF